MRSNAGCQEFGALTLRSTGRTTIDGNLSMPLLCTGVSARGVTAARGVEHQEMDVLMEPGDFVEVGESGVLDTAGAIPPRLAPDSMERSSSHVGETGETQVDAKFDRSISETRARSSDKPQTFVEACQLAVDDEASKSSSGVPRRRSTAKGRAGLHLAGAGSADEARSISVTRARSSEKPRTIAEVTCQLAVDSGDSG